jgi:hypothetical protein
LNYERLSGFFEIEIYLDIDFGIFRALFPVGSSVCFPTLSFDFSVIYNFSTWTQLIFMQSWMTVFFYLVIWRPNRKALLKEKPQESEAF